MRIVKNYVDLPEQQRMTLFVLLPLPGLSENDNLPTFQMIGKFQDNFEIFKKNYPIVYTKDMGSKWELIEYEVNINKESIFEAIVVGFYKPLNYDLEETTLQKFIEESNI